MTLKEGISRGERVRPVEAIVERITEAALRYRGNIFTGPNHGVALTELGETYPGFNEKSIETGFLTSDDRFVDRGEAYAIAHKQKQLKRTFGGSIEGRELDSDDVQY